MAAGDSTNSVGDASRSTRAAPLRELMAEHRRLDDLFLRHQALLVEGRPEESRLALAHFRAALLGHMRGEETVILPFYAAHAAIPKGGKPGYFEAEHRKLRRLVEEGLAWMEAWRGLTWPPEEVVHLIEREKVFKEVMEHHDEREDHLLYPGIEDAAGETEVRGLAERFWAVARPEEQRLREAAVEPGSIAGPGEPGSLVHVVRAADMACGWLEPIYLALESGEVPVRAPAPWDEALERLRAARRRLMDLGSMARAVAVLDDLVTLLEEVTPLKRFPAQRAAEAHGAWHLLRACRRAARVPPEDTA